MREGLRYVQSTPILRDALVMMAIIGTLSYEFQVILPLLARFTFHGTATTYAALTAAMGAGAVVGGLVTASRRNAGPPGLVRAAFVFGGTILIAAVAPTLGVALAAMVLVGVGSVVFLSLGTTTLQIEAAPEMRGRVMALWSVAFLGSTPIGGPIVGFVGEHAGPRWGLVLGGVAALGAGVIGLNTLLRARPAAPAVDSPASVERGGAPVVTLSASYGAGGSVVGPTLARRLGVPFLDRAIPAAVAEELADPSTMALPHAAHPPPSIGVMIARAATAALPDGATVEFLAEAGPDEEAVFQAKTEQVLREFADWSGGVILGRAGAIVLADHPHAVHVRLDGPRAARLARVVAEEHVDEHTAAQRVDDNDRAREAYVHHFYGANPDDPALYDLTIDSTSMSIEDCVEAIIAAAGGSATDAHP